MRCAGACLLACLLVRRTEEASVYCGCRENVQSDNAETQGELVRRAWQRSGRRSCCCWVVGGGEVGRRVGRRGQQQRKRRFGNLVESGGGRTGAFGPLETVKGGGWDRRRRSSVSSEHLSSKAGRRSGFGWIWPGLAGHDPCGKLRWLSWRDGSCWSCSPQEAWAAELSIPGSHARGGPAGWRVGARPRYAPRELVAAWTTPAPAHRSFHRRPKCHQVGVSSTSGYPTVRGASNDPGARSGNKGGELTGVQYFRWPNIRLLFPPQWPKGVVHLLCNSWLARFTFVLAAVLNRDAISV